VAEGCIRCESVMMGLVVTARSVIIAIGVCREDKVERM